MKYCLTLKEAVQYIGFSRTHIVKMIQMGKIPARKSSNGKGRGRHQYMILRNDLEDYIQSLPRVRPI